MHLVTSSNQFISPITKIINKKKKKKKKEKKKIKEKKIACSVNLKVDKGI